MHKYCSRLHFSPNVMIVTFSFHKAERYVAIHTNSHSLYFTAMNHISRAIICQCVVFSDIHTTHISHLLHTHMHTFLTTTVETNSFSGVIFILRMDFKQSEPNYVISSSILNEVTRDFYIVRDSLQRRFTRN